MKKLTILLLALLCAGVVFGQQKVAVYVTSGKEGREGRDGKESAGINKVLGDQLVAAIVKSGKYTAIERTSNFLTELEKEQVYQRTGAVDDNQISRLGKQFGVQLVCVAEVSNVLGQKYISARLIDVETAEVINTANATSPLKDMNEFLTVTESITKELTGKTAKEQAAESEKIITAKEAKEAAELKAKEAGYHILGNLAVSTVITTAVKWETASQMAKEATMGDYRDWRLPTISELIQLYANKEKVYGANASTPWRDGTSDADATMFYSVWSSDVCKKGYKVVTGFLGRESCNAKKGKVILVRDIK